MKKLLASIFILGLFTFGCDRCPDVPGLFDIQGVTVQNGLIYQGTNGSPGYSFPDSVKLEHLGLIVSYQVNYYSAKRPNSFSLVPAAYALECVEPGEGGTKEKIESLELIALSDYNTSFKSGASLNQIIQINGLPVEKFIENQNNNSIDQYGFYIKLTQKPDPTIKHAFKLKFKLQNGEEYSPETELIKIF